MGSAAEAEVRRLYINALESSPMRTTLEELDHSQPPTPIRTDNSWWHVNDIGTLWSITAKEILS